MPLAVNFHSPKGIYLQVPVLSGSCLRRKKIDPMFRYRQVSLYGELQNRLERDTNVRSNINN